MLGFDAVRRRRDAQEERGTKTRRGGRGKEKMGREKRVLAAIFYFFLI